MRGQDAQKELLAKVAEAAARERCLVAPVGSLYFLFRGIGRQYTKDIDAVIHNSQFGAASLDELMRIAAHLGTGTISVDQAMVSVTTGPGLNRADIELIRGRAPAKGGFFPRKLLEAAAGLARQEGNVLFYPVEFVLVLKADAAIDREERAKRDPKKAESHAARAKVFRSDVFDETNRALLSSGLRREFFDAALGYLKKNRRVAVSGLLDAAGAPLGDVPYKL